MPSLCKLELAWSRDQQTVSIKGQTINISGLVGHAVFVETTQLWPCSAKTALYNIHVSEQGNVPIKHYLWTPKSEVHMSWNYILLLILGGGWEEVGIAIL